MNLFFKKTFRNNQLSYQAAVHLAYFPGGKILGKKGGKLILRARQNQPRR